MLVCYKHLHLLITCVTSHAYTVYPVSSIYEASSFIVVCLFYIVQTLYMNVKKLIASASAVAVAFTGLAPVLNANADAYTDALQSGYNWLYSIGGTSTQSFADFNAYGTASREAVAKFAVSVADSIGISADSSKACSFNDLDTAQYGLCLLYTSPSPRDA